MLVVGMQLAVWLSLRWYIVVSPVLDMKYITVSSVGSRVVHVLLLIFALYSPQSLRTSCLYMDFGVTKWRNGSRNDRKSTFCCGIGYQHTQVWKVLASGHLDMIRISFPWVVRSIWLCTFSPGYHEAICASPPRTSNIESRICAGFFLKAPQEFERQRLRPDEDGHWSA